MLTSLDLMRLHVEALFVHDAAGDLACTNEPVAQPAPRFFLGHTTGGLVRRFRHDVPAGTRRLLDVAIGDAGRFATPRAADTPLDPAPFERILAADAPVEHTSIGIAFGFPHALPRNAGMRTLRSAADAALLHPLLATWAADIEASAPLVAAIVGGQAVAVCGSARILPRAHEAGVETAEPFRGRGYARSVVAAWSAEVRALGAEPLYSTTWDNRASRGLARSLGLSTIGRDLHVR